MNNFISMNIVFIGMRGSGKTTISKLLGEKLGYPYIETDDRIEKKVGMKIADFVKKNGWEAFRTKEGEIIQELSTCNHTVISGGGGTVLRKENVNVLKANGIFIYLTASLSTLYERIKDDTSRPFLTTAATQKEDIKRTRAERKKIYQEAADFTISTETHTKKEVVEEVYRYLQGKNIL